jgi:hypothetical protein
MKNYFSIVSFLNNQISGEKIAIGLIFLKDETPFVRFSKAKINLAKKINPLSFSLLTSNIKNFEPKFLNNINKLKNESNFSLDNLYRLNGYEQGIINISTPKLFNAEINTETVEYYFNEWIENKSHLEKEEIIKPKKESTIKQTVKTNLAIYKERIDINYRVEKENIPDLFFDYRLDVIAANGSLITAKSVDLENQKSGSIENSIAKYELLLDCLIPFSEKKLHLKSSGHENLLLINKPLKGSENEELYHKLKNQRQFKFKVAELDQLSKLKSVIAKHGVSKFSERLLA